MCSVTLRFPPHFANRSDFHMAAGQPWSFNSGSVLVDITFYCAAYMGVTVWHTFICAYLIAHNMSGFPHSYWQLQQYDVMYALCTTLLTHSEPGRLHSHGSRRSPHFIDRTCRHFIPKDYANTEYNFDWRSALPHKFRLQTAHISAYDICLRICHIYTLDCCYHFCTVFTQAPSYYK